MLAVSIFLGLDLDTVLEVFGGFFYVYVKEKGYGETLKTLGPDLRSFLQNLDFHHFFLENHVWMNQTMESPTFRCEVDETDGHLLLHYNSARAGLQALAIGKPASASLQNRQPTPFYIQVPSTYAGPMHHWEGWSRTTDCPDSHIGP